MPDFTLKPTFPIGDVINAAQKKAALEQQSQEQGNQSIIQGLQSIGQIGQNLVEKRMKVAQALALGSHFGIAPEVAKTMDPDQILKIAAVEKGGIDAEFLKMAMAGLAGRGKPTADAATASNATPAQPAQNGAVLAGGTSATAVPPTPEPLQPPVASTGTVPVPIQAPPSRPKMVNPATAKIALDVAKANALEPVVTRAEAEATGGVKHGTHILPDTTGTDKKEQDAYWRDAVRGIQSIRGDSELKNIEAQRTAATMAYNRLKQIKMEGKLPNPVDYADIVGQVYKARTGQAPTETILKKALQETAAGKWGETMTFLTGQQRAATTGSIADSLMDMVSHMGLQADELHDGYMQVHGSHVFNPNMSEENAKKLSKLSRGKSFADATGIKPEDFDPHVQAIKWAQENPNDPRSAEILKKAQSELSAKSGGSIGL